jgi:Brp/Blh family beta-carotene 15,15'-monooxygenase
MVNHPKAPAKQALLFFLPITQLTILWIVSWLLPYDLSSIIWVVALLVLGMAHGAMDIVIIKKHVTNRNYFDTWKKVGWYLSLMLAAWIGLMLAPVLTVLSFLILTAIHFGEADRTSFTDFFEKSPEFSKSWAWVRGSLVVALPCYFYPRESWEPFGSITATPGGESLDVILKTFSLSLLGLSSFLAAISFFKCPKQIFSYGFLFFVLESIVAVFWFLSTPPLLAIGGYFLCMHATRHMQKLMSQFYSTKGNSIFSKQVKMHIDSLAFGLPAILFVIAWALFLDSGSLIQKIAYTSIGFYLISTLPHHILVSKMLKESRLSIQA